MTASVRDIIRARAAAGSMRGQRADPHHLALVVEGGGMRGVVAGGMVSALEARGLRDCFDTIHGSSAGACAGAYFLAGQSRAGTSIYYEDINNRQFIDAMGPLRGRAIMNTHFLIDHVMRSIKPLDVDRIRQHQGVLHVVATDVASGQARVFNTFRDTEHFFRVLKASITIPVIAGSPVEVDGERLADGGMVQQIALQSALDAGATHVLVLMTRRAGALERQDHPARLLLEASLLRLMYNDVMARTYRGRNTSINQVVARATAADPSDTTVIASVSRPATASDIDRLTVDDALLRRADDEAQAAVCAYLDDGSEA